MKNGIKLGCIASGRLDGETEEVICTRCCWVCCWGSCVCPGLSSPGGSIGEYWVGLVRVDDPGEGWSGDISFLFCRLWGEEVVGKMNGTGVTLQRLWARKKGQLEFFTQGTGT
jgi:hypothetical protein